MGGISNNYQVVVTRNKESLDFHTSGLRVITTNVAIGKKDKERFLDKSASYIQLLSGGATRKIRYIFL